MEPRQPISPRGRDVLLGQIDWSRVSKTLGLSDREVEVTRGILSGAGRDELARQMGIAVGTIKTYSQRIYRKLGLNSPVDLTLEVVSVEMGLHGSGTWTRETA